MRESKAPTDVEFEEFFREVEPGLRRALFSVLGVERGREATAEALAWSWENWVKVKELKNPTGFLFRVGQSRTRSKRTPAIFARPDWNDPWVEPKLGPALAQLSDRQRLAVVLVFGFGWTMRDVADLTNTKVTTIQNHLDRGLRKLRAALEVHEYERPV